MKIKINMKKMRGDSLRKWKKSNSDRKQQNFYKLKCKKWSENVMNRRD